MSKKFVIIAAVAIAVAFPVFTHTYSACAQTLMEGRPPVETPPPVDRASRLKAAEAKLEAIKGRIEEINKPFFEEGDRLNDALDVEYKPFAARIAVLEGEKKTALDAAQGAQRREIKKSYDQKIQDVRAEFLISSHAQRRRDEINQRRMEALGSLPLDYLKAEADVFELEGPESSE